MLIKPGFSMRLVCPEDGDDAQALLDVTFGAGIGVETLSVRGSSVLTEADLRVLRADVDRALQAIVKVKGKKR